MSGEKIKSIPELINHIEAILSHLRRTSVEVHQGADMVLMAYYAGRVEELDNLLYLLEK